MNDAEDELTRAQTKIEHLEELYLEQLQEIASLRNENRLLREKLEGRPATELEKSLLRMAKAILREYEHDPEKTNE